MRTKKEWSAGTHIIFTDRPFCSQESFHHAALAENSHCIVIAAAVTWLRRYNEAVTPWVLVHLNHSEERVRETNKRYASSVRLSHVGHMDGKMGLVAHDQMEENER